MRYLRDYQKDTLKVFSRDSSALDASDMGTGKTLTAVERVRDLHAERVLVVCPLNTVGQWMSAFQEQYPSLRTGDKLRVLGTPRSTPDLWKEVTDKRKGVYIIGWAAMRGVVPHETREKHSKKSTKVLPITDKALSQAMRDGDVPPWNKSGTWDLIIADEIHEISSPNSTQAKVLKKIKTHNKLGLSGTPGGSKIEGLWSVLNWLWPKKYTSFWEWAYTWFHVKEEVYGRGSVKRTVESERTPGLLWTSIPCVVRHRLEDVAPQLPPVIERDVWIDMEPTQQEIYEDFEKEYVAWVGEIPVLAKGAAPQRERLRQAALGVLKASELSNGDLDVSFDESAFQPKVSATEEIISRLPENEPVIVFTHSAKWARMAAKKINRTYGPAYAWTGALSARERSRLREGFGTSVRILVAQINAIGVGTDGLQNVCRCEIWASALDGNVITNQQAEARIHRPGQQWSVQRWRLLSRKTIDDTERQRNLEKSARLSVLKRDHVSR